MRRGRRQVLRVLRTMLVSNGRPLKKKGGQKRAVSRGICKLLVRVHLRQWRGQENGNACCVLCPCVQTMAASTHPQDDLVGTTGTRCVSQMRSSIQTTVAISIDGKMSGSQKIHHPVASHPAGSCFQRERALKNAQHPERSGCNGPLQGQMVTGKVSRQKAQSPRPRAHNRSILRSVQGHQRHQTRHPESCQSYRCRCWAEIIHL
mmetsp:Transcript_8989/g.16211  ORF Transcript_8989/g.16211 Transcript_8989/m.16211 type:complete len:205 (-) Transcript_8989:447-1061(-)